jgi:predicted RNase H-like HicB family nuclease
LLLNSLRNGTGNFFSEAGKFGLQNREFRPCNNDFIPSVYTDQIGAEFVATDYGRIAFLFENSSFGLGCPQRRTVVRYTVVLEQESDGGYVAIVPALAGCVSQGSSRAEALANIREAIELYVEDCRDAGDPVPSEVGKEFVEVEAA